MLGPSTLFTRRLLRWYDRCRRNLPWRVGAESAATAGRTTPDPYLVLVSEAMLQQTQVTTVVPYFHRFVTRFPTLADLAAADEQEVLRLWQGLGYYSRARNLQAAARQVQGEYGGRIPREVGKLRELPGVGRYTAGAVASIAFNRRAPIVDGNVARVLCRIDKIETDLREPAVVELLWRRAAEILPKSRVGDFNSALMELGAMVCTPRSPQCLLCPVREHCEAFAAGVQALIPAPRKAKPTPLLRRHTYCIRRRGDGCWLIEQRPPRGRWAGMWQFVTAQRPEGGGDRGGAFPLPVPTTAPRRIGTVTHGLTHRRYEFEVFVCEATDGVGSAGAADAADDDSATRAWTGLEGLSRYPLPRPHLKIAEMLAASTKDDTTGTAR